MSEEERVQKAYAEGRARFMGIELEVGPGALVPRDETEILGRAALEILPKEARVIDMCCGSGNLACAIATHLPGARVWATDLTDGCVAIARRNVARLGLEGRVEVAQGDLFSALGGLEGTIDAVVCNPPYISTGRLEKDRRALLDHEPREAFDGGPYGLSIHQRVIKDAPAFLVPGGWLLFELGLGQDRQVELLFKRSTMYDARAQRTDSAGSVRVIMAQKKA